MVNANASGQDNACTNCVNMLLVRHLTENMGNAQQPGKQIPYLEAHDADARQCVRSGVLISVDIYIFIYVCLST